mgnify:CR=1 FL=1|tara:strand:- start:52 stop:414 length:363 start_codon:yes stop_codon:yes gene_type:complete
MYYLVPLVKTVPNNPVIVNMINPDQYLLSSILLETLSTTLLKKTVENKLWFVPTYLGYGISFYIFPKSLVKYSLSNAYTIWCSVGIILTTLIDYVFYKQIINFNKIVGIILILSGIKISK